MLYHYVHDCVNDEHEVTLPSFCDRVNCCNVGDRTDRLPSFHSHNSVG